MLCVLADYARSIYDGLSDSGRIPDGAQQDSGGAVEGALFAQSLPQNDRIFVDDGGPTTITAANAIRRSRVRTRWIDEQMQYHVINVIHAMHCNDCHEGERVLVLHFVFAIRLKVLIFLFVIRVNTGHFMASFLLCNRSLHISCR